MKKTPIKDILNYTLNEGDIRIGEAGTTYKTLRVAINLRLLVADKIDSKGVAIRFKLTHFGYDLASKLA